MVSISGTISGLRIFWRGNGRDLVRRIYLSSLFFVRTMHYFVLVMASRKRQSTEGRGEQARIENITSQNDRYSKDQHSDDRYTNDW